MVCFTVLELYYRCSTEDYFFAFKGPWDVLRKVFSKEDHKNMTIHDKCDLFFYDYNIAPLFVQENYLSVKPLNIKYAV